MYKHSYNNICTIIEVIFITTDYYFEKNLVLRVLKIIKIRALKLH